VTLKTSKPARTDFYSLRRWLRGRRALPGLPVEQVHQRRAARASERLDDVQLVGDDIAIHLIEVGYCDARYANATAFASALAAPAAAQH
jgi:hypothetical protein